MTETATSDDALLGGRLVLRQPRTGHRAGHDAVLLAGATRASAGDRVADFGSGVGAAGLALARRVPGLELVMIEIDSELAALARDNATRNDIGATVAVIDLAAPAETFRAAGLSPDSVDVVLMNPPFNEAGRHQASPDQARAVAHVAGPQTLEVWVHAARRVLRSQGELTLIWRADGMAEVLAALARGFGSVEIVAVHADAGKPAIRILVRAVKGGRAPLRLHPPLMLKDESGLPTKLAAEVFDGRRALPLAMS